MHHVTTLIALTVLFGFGCVYGQDSQPNKPIELPEFIVTGKQRVDVPGGAKQPPTKPSTLKSAQIDSLNPTERQPIPSLPAHKLPSMSRATLLYPGYLEAQVGNYFSPSIEAGYSARADDYLLDFSGKIQSSNGWVNNADFVKSNLTARSTYIAPSQFIFFGGSTTTVLADCRNTNYALFANPSADRRNVFSAGVGLDIAGKNQDVAYKAEVGYGRMNVNTADRSSGNSLLHGKASVMQVATPLSFGLEADARIQSYASNAYPYTMVGGLASVESGKLLANAGVGFQWASSTTAQSRPGVNIKADVRYALNGDVSLIGRFVTGLRPASFSDIIAASPFVDDSMVIDFTYDVVDVKAALQYHPNVKLFATAGLHITQSERDLVYQSSKPGMFAPTYLTSTSTVIFGDVRWALDAVNTISADMAVTSAGLDSGKAKPYIAPFTASASYQRNWTWKLRSSVSVLYIGDRWADVANTKQLSGYVDIRLAVVYDLLRNANVFVQAQNLIGSTIVLWDGYRERGTFISAGINWRF